ncbi:hypothetical protein WDW89_01500, partial [Deltaproteobacteria bacterium TL4]
GSQSSFGQEVAELIRPYQKEEGARLSARMSPKRITMLEDETFIQTGGFQKKGAKEQYPDSRLIAGLAKR